MMMNKKIFLAAALFISFNINAQVKNEVDSLLKVLDKQKADSNIERTLSRIGNYYIDNNPNKALEYFEKSAALARKLNLKLPLANTYYDMGFCYLLKGNFDKSLDHYQQSANIYEKLDDKRRLTNAYMSIGNVFFQTHSLKKAGEYYDKAESITKITKDTTQLSSLLAERGIMYDQSGQYDSAINYLKKALNISRLNSDSFLVTASLSNLGISYKHKKNNAIALQYFDSVLMKYNARNDVGLDELASVYNNIGATQAQAGNYAKASEAFAKSITYANKGQMASITMENYRNLSDMYADMKDYKQQSNFLKKYYALKDSLFSSDNKNKLTQLETDYQLEKKNISLAKQETETTRQKNQRNIFIIIATAAALLLITLAFFYRRIRQNNILLKDRNTQINKQKDELQTLNQVKDRLFSIISHDLRNPLVSLKTYLSLADNPALSPEKKENFKKQTTQAVSQTSNMLDNLLVWANMQLKNTKPPIVNINLLECIEDAIAAVQAQALQKNIEINKSVTVIKAPADYNIMEIALRNIITNAVKFSSAGSKIFISSFSNNGNACISIKDEGIGMSRKQIDELLNGDIDSTAGTEGEKGSGLGLFLVKGLLQKINASLKIESTEGKGSDFIISLAA